MEENINPAIIFLCELYELDNKGTEKRASLDICALLISYYSSFLFDCLEILAKPHELLKMPELEILNTFGITQV